MAVYSRNLQIPIALDLRLAAWFERENVCWREALDAGKERIWGRHVAEGQIGGDGVLVELARHIWMGEHTLDLAGEDEGPRRAPVIERLLAHTVAAQDQPLASPVPDRKRKHAVELARERDGVVRLGEVGEHLRVALGAQHMTGATQFVSQRPEVVDLAVQYGSDRSVLVCDRRITVDEVDDREAVLADHA